ncbi:MAG: hypothetical protein QHJ81_03645 [Anaerolineae bacterium]|nr:hypothetical protein [Anaerolineae bacterium]
MDVNGQLAEQFQEAGAFRLGQPTLPFGAEQGIAHFQPPERRHNCLAFLQALQNAQRMSVRFVFAPGQGDRSIQYELSQVTAQRIPHPGPGRDDRSPK